MDLGGPGWNSARPGGRNGPEIGAGLGPELGARGPDWAESESESHGYDKQDIEPSVVGEREEETFEVEELEILGHRCQEWRQAGKKKKPAVLLSIWEEMQGLDRNKELRGSKVQTKCKLIQDWLNKPLCSKKPCITLRSSYKYSVQAVVCELYQEQIQERLAKMKVEEGDTHGSKQIQQYQNALTAVIQDDLTEEQLAAAEDIVERWNGREGPVPETKARNAAKYGYKYVQNFAMEMWRYCRIRIVCMAGWKNEEGTIQACIMDFNNEIMDGIPFNDVCTLEGSWREYLGETFEEPGTPPEHDGESSPKRAWKQTAAKATRMGKVDSVKLVKNANGEIWIGEIVVRQWKYQKTPAPKYKKNPGRKNVKGKGKAREEGVVDDSADDSADDSMDDSLDDHGEAEGSDVGIDDPSTKQVSGGRQNRAKTPFPSRSHSNPPPADGSHMLTDNNGRESNSHDSDDEADEDTYLPTLSNSKKLATSLNRSEYTTELQDHSEYADADGSESIPFTDLPTEEGSTSRNKGGKLKSTLKRMHKASSFLQEREPTTLAEGGIVAVMDPHENLMNWFLNEREPTAPPVDAPPVTDEKLNRMDGSSTPAQDMTMQVDFLADLQNVRELSPLPITHESSNLRDPSPQPNSLTNLLAQLQDMREPTPPLLVSNVPVKS
ncbi:hypothetical protein BKA82DRAFT_4359068 [Pisolithus tinctorius]|nr:hypothetical protein BKA82DRAFT_4359068 [Pisolithus tinctorius]